jgi:nucleoside phosphorylase
VEIHLPPTCREEFEIAIICALGHEYTAVEDVIDQFWDNDGDNYGKLRGDPNHYTTGRIGQHNIVLVLLPEMGKANASSAANSIRLSYTGVKLALVVGICGAVPKNGDEDIMLGDVIIGEKVVQHDFGRRYGDKFYRKSHHLGKANKEVSSITGKYKTPRSKKNVENHAAEILKDLQSRMAAQGRRGEYDDPGYASDRLFKPDYRHRHTVSPSCICASCLKDADPTCSVALVSTCKELQCDEQEMIHREPRSSSIRTPIIHIGAIASGDTVMKSGIQRDTIANELDVIAFEMEGCGVWEELPCLVIKGVCDYADSHKDKVWQKFAAASAASVAKAVIHRYIKTDKASGGSSRGSELSMGDRWETNTNGSHI